MNERVEVKVGQLWADCDKRMGGRTLRVELVGIVERRGHHAEFARCKVGAGPALYTVIRTERMSPPRFKLVRDENGKRVDEESR